LSHAVPRAGIVFRCAAVAAVCSVLLACDPHHERGLPGRASDQWLRSYALNPDGELQIVAGSGSIEVTAGTAPTVEVRAERVVRASSDASARGLVPSVRIREEATPDRILLQDQGFGDTLAGASVEVHFHVSVPPSTRLRLRMLNGNITVSSVDAAVVASTTNGQIHGSALVGRVDARTTNGSVTLDLTRVSDPVTVEVVEGAIDLTLPPDANADLQAECTNGSLDVARLSLQMDDAPTTHRVRGRLAGGGVTIALTTLNGNIQVRPRS
jgi:Putative adhesin